jgi:transcriptional antiterminator RfaH
MPTAAPLSDLSWYCLRSQAKREHITATNLRERVGVDVFAPRIRRILSTRRGLLMNATEALFPGYLFARFVYPEHVRHVMSTCGVTGVVAFGARPPAVADPVIEYLRREVAEAEHASAAPILETGSWVRILSGCFQYIEGRVLHFDPRTERVRLLLTMLGSEVQVSIPAGRVALLSESRPLYPTGLMTAHTEASFRVPCAV